MVTGNEVSAVSLSRVPSGISACGNSKPVTTFAETAISTTGCPLPFQQRRARQSFQMPRQLPLDLLDRLSARLTRQLFRNLPMRP
jgi:hypothetical protein